MTESAFPIKHEWGGHGRGRYVVSARPIKRGEVVLEALPYALAPKLPSLTCTRCFRFHPPSSPTSPSPSSTSSSELQTSQFADGSDEDEDDDGAKVSSTSSSAAASTSKLHPCSLGCGAAFYCSPAEEADDRPLHGLECVAWRRVREVGASMELTESEEAELRLVFRIAARHHRETLDHRFADDEEDDDEADDEDEDDDETKGRMRTRKKGMDSTQNELTEPTYDDVLRLCSNREKRPIEEMTFWRRVVQRVVAPLVQTAESSAGRGVAWAKYDFVELICKNLCNGFGLRGAGGQCYAYGVYPAASYFNHSCYPNICRIEQDAGQAPGRSRQSIRFVALVDIPAGRELSLSYIDGSKPTEQRRLALSSIYFFHCMCARCETSGTSTSGGKANNKKKKRHKDDYVQRFVCGSCTKNNGRGVMYPVSPTHNRCNLCHRTAAVVAHQRGPNKTVARPATTPPPPPPQQ